MLSIKNTVFLLTLVLVSNSCSVLKKNNKTEKEEVTEENNILLEELELVESIEETIEPHKGSRKKIIDILHTNLYIDFDWEKEHVIGQAQIKLKPFNKEIKTITLDAKDFEVKEIKNLNTRNKLKFSSDSTNIHVYLDKFLSPNETITLDIKYKAQPSKSKYIKNNRLGLFFKQDKNYNKHIWTQGEVQDNSCWFPTIDSPNEKMTQDIYIFLDKNQTSLSNGNFIETKHINSTKKVDHWRLNKSHSTYLTMLFVGDFSLIKDSWQKGDLSYYVEPKYTKRAKEVFGKTPDILQHYSTILKTDYPWENLGQVVVRDFSAGGMENTGAIVYYDRLYESTHDLMGENHDDLIAHEIFHQWFGDLVTCESWANLSLNESFATYGEYLWLEKDRGDLEADYHLDLDLNNYLQEATFKREPVINYKYEKEWDLFDHHRYAKGARIIHMLRKFVGEDLFFASLKKYLSDNKFKNTELAHLRLAFEEITGEDLHWFFNQWFNKKGHPELEIDYKYENQEVILSVTQTQSLESYPLYKLPVQVDIYSKSSVKRHSITITKQKQEFRFNSAEKPKLVDFDAEKMLLAEIDYPKPTEDLTFQFLKTYLFKSKQEALEALFRSSVNNMEPIVDASLKNEFWYFRVQMLENFDVLNPQLLEKYYIQVIDIARKDKHPKVRLAALKCLNKNYKDRNFDAIIHESLNDYYSHIRAYSLLLLSEKDKEKTALIAKKWDKLNNKQLDKAVANFYSKAVNPAYLEYFERKIKEHKQIDFYYYFAQYLPLQDKGHIARGIDFLEKEIENAPSDNEKNYPKRGLRYLHENLSKEPLKFTELIERINYILK